MNVLRLFGSIALGGMAMVIAAPAIWASPTLASPADAWERESRPTVATRLFYGDDGMTGMEIDRQDGRVRVVKPDRADKAEPTPPPRGPAARSRRGPRPPTAPGR